MKHFTLCIITLISLVPTASFAEEVVTVTQLQSLSEAFTAPNLCGLVNLLNQYFLGIVFFATILSLGWIHISGMTAQNAAYQKTLNKKMRSTVLVLFSLSVSLFFILQIFVGPRICETEGLFNALNVARPPTELEETIIRDGQYSREWRVSSEKYVIAIGYIEPNTTCYKTSFSMFDDVEQCRERLGEQQNTISTRNNYTEVRYYYECTHWQNIDQPIKVTFDTPACSSSN